MDLPVVVTEPVGSIEGALACLSSLAISSQELGLRAGQFREAAVDDGSRGAVESRNSLEKRLVLVEQICAAIRVLARDGNRFRRMEARALYAEGLTMAQLAGVFGVSRQRVSMLLREGAAGPAGAGGGSHGDEIG